MSRSETVRTGDPADRAVGAGPVPGETSDQDRCPADTTGAHTVTRGRIVSARLAPEVEANLLARAGVVLIQRRGDRVSLYHPDSDQLARLVLALDGTDLEVIPRSPDDALTTPATRRRP